MGRERVVLSTLIVLLIVLWAGFAIHRTPRFPGSLTGGVLAVSGAALMVAFSLAYTAVKRIPGLKQRQGKRISLGRLLKWHVYTGAVGAIVALLHTGHRFESDLGIALTALVLITALSGYIGRHMLARVALELREKRDQLSKLETAYNEAVGKIVRTPDPVLKATASHGGLAWMRGRAAIARAGSGQARESLPYRAVHMAESIAELEYSIRSHEHFKRLAAGWLKVHIAGAVLLIVLLGLHVWASIYFGLRWFD